MTDIKLLNAKVVGLFIFVLEIRSKSHVVSSPYRAVNAVPLGYKNQSVDIFFSWRYNPHWGLYFTAL